jgi:hypothetical protein
MAVLSPKVRNKLPLIFLFAALLKSGLNEYIKTDIANTEIKVRYTLLNTIIIKF